MTRQQAPVTRLRPSEPCRGRQACARDVEVGLLDEIVDHSLQTHVRRLRAIDAADAVSVQFP